MRIRINYTRNTIEQLHSNSKDENNQAQNESQKSKGEGDNFVEER